MKTHAPTHRDFLVFSTVTESSHEQSRAPSRLVGMETIFELLVPARLGAVMPALLAASLVGCTQAPSPHPTTPDDVQQEADGTYTRSLCPDPTAEVRCRARVRTDASGTPLRFVSPETSRDIAGTSIGTVSKSAYSTDQLGAADLATAYDIQRDTAHHPIVAVLAFGDYASAESDLATYRTYNGLPACTSQNGCFTKLNQSGATSPLPAAAPSGYVGEMMLDLDMVSAGCPDCYIILAETDSVADVPSTISGAAAHGSRAVTISYGWGAPSTASGDSYFNIPGVSIFVASGDSGWNDPTEVVFPSTSRYVTAVGGTRLKKDTTTSRGFDEVAWTSSATSWAAAFSDCSTLFPKPSWQTAATQCSMRASSDISAVASNVLVYSQGAWELSGGTSVSAPLVAGIYAESHIAGADPGLPYRISNTFHDITAGFPDNSSAYYDDDGVRASCGGSPICTVGAGWDGPTGLGTPDGKALDPVRVTLPLSVEALSDVPGTVSLTYTAATATTLTMHSTAFGEVPTSVTIPAGSTTASFVFYPSVVSTNEHVTVTATCTSGAMCAGAVGQTFTIVEPRVRSCCVPGCTTGKVCSSSCQCVLPKAGVDADNASDE